MTEKRRRPAPAPARKPAPDGMLEWLAKDRAMVSFADRAAIASGKQGLQKIVRQWIKPV